MRNLVLHCNFRTLYMRTEKSRGSHSHPQHSPLPHNAQRMNPTHSQSSAPLDNSSPQPNGHASSLIPSTSYHSSCDAGPSVGSHRNANLISNPYSGYHPYSSSSSASGQGATSNVPSAQPMKRIKISSKLL